MKRLFAIASTAVFSISVHAQSNLPASQSTNGISYVCGGVSSEESDAMKAASKNYDLMVTFAANDGSYVADAKVSLEKQDGQTMMQATCSGPIMLVKAAQPGSYRIRAELNGNAQTKTVELQPGRGTRSVSFAWPANPAPAQR